MRNVNKLNWRSISWVNLSKLISLDEDILKTLFFRGWGLIAGAVTIVLLPLFISPVEQGYYFTFGSVLACQVFFELGLSQVITRIVSHETAFLSEDSKGSLIGEVMHLDRLSSLSKVVNLWYRNAAILFIIIGGISGAMFIGEKNELPLGRWLFIWAILIFFTGLNLWLSPRLAFIEGHGKVAVVARLRLIQSMMGYSVLWLAMVCGGGLWVIVILPICNGIYTYHWLNSSRNTFQILFERSVNKKRQINWSKEIFPLQWRFAVSWLSGYFIFNLFTPITFNRFGAIESGKLGLALTIFAAISVIGMSWVNAKSPKLSAHISRGERSKLNHLFKSIVIRSTILVAFLSLLFVILVWILNYLNHPWANRILPPYILLVVAVINVINTAINAMAIYMRAHREEPMLIQSVTMALLTISIIYLTSNLGLLTMMLSYMGVNLFISLPWTTWLFIRYWRKV